LLSHQRINELVAHQRIKGVSLTGSQVAGASVAAEAGKYFKKPVLELGGSDAFIILEDAGIDQAVAWAVVARINSNSTTICAVGLRFCVG
jgi:succinate-semialdehyde dehydrogenase / glutarate-semialdehyde dehydrogenase